MAGAEGVARLIARGAANHPEKTAIVADGRAYSYAALDAAAQRLAAAFAEAGLAGERVGLMLPNGFAMLCCLLACFRAGTVATPIDRRCAPPELERALAETRPKWLVIDRSRREILAKVTRTVVRDCRVIVVGGEDAASFEGLVAREARAPGSAAPAAASPAVLFFTSGSTGRPKGVVHSQASARAMLESTAAAFGGVRDNDIIQVAEPLTHPSGFIDSLSVLLGGGTVVLLDGFEEAPYVASLRRWRPTLVCTHIDVLIKLMRWPASRREDFTSLRGVFTGGDRVPRRWQQEFMALTGLPIQVGWGMTEAIWLTLAPAPPLERDGCIGRPLDGVELRVTDPDGRDLPAGAIGEFRVRGPMVMQGYWQNPQETARTIVDGWLRTGDSGWRDADGTCWFAARLKELIVRNTSKITPGEVEAALDAHDAVAASGVVGVPDPQEGEVPVAFVALKPGRTADEAELLAFLDERIARYKIPVRIRFVAALPETRSGKLDHHALQVLAEDTA